MIKIGIEQEIVFKSLENKFLDFENTNYKMYQDIIKKLPFYEEDKKYFECKSLENIPKRWYIEGIELFDDEHKLVETLPKAIEIRTSPHINIKSLVEEFSQSFNLLEKEASSQKIYPVLTSSNPFRDKFEKEIEIQPRDKKNFDIAKNSMLTYGMHVNISIDSISLQSLKKIKDKINYYMPFIIPFSFSSPFLNSQEFKGLCYRNYKRAETRELVNIKQYKDINIIEFRAFDACASKELLSALIYLIKAIIKAKCLDKHTNTQDKELIKKSAINGFNDIVIKKGCKNILDSVNKNIPEIELKLLKSILKTNNSYASIMKSEYLIKKNIIETISNQYKY